MGGNWRSGTVIGRVDALNKISFPPCYHHHRDAG